MLFQVVYYRTQNDDSLEFSFSEFLDYCELCLFKCVAGGAAQFRKKSNACIGIWRRWDIARCRVYTIEYVNL